MPLRPTDDRKRRDRHRLDRAFLAALTLTHADLLEPHGNRVAIRHRLHLRRDDPDEKPDRACTRLRHSKRQTQVAF